MHKTVFLQRSLWMMWTSLAVLLSLSGIVHAQRTDKAVASQEISSGVRVDVLELKRTSGGTVTLTFTVVNSAGANFNLTDTLSTPGQVGGTWDVAKVALLDVPNKKKYLVMRDSEKNCVCSRGGFSDREMKGGTSRTFWAKFQAPPENVTKMTIEMPGTPPFEDLPITQ